MADDSLELLERDALDTIGDGLQVREPGTIPGERTGPDQVARAPSARIGAVVRENHVAVRGEATNGAPVAQNLGPAVAEPLSPAGFTLPRTAPVRADTPATALPTRRGLGARSFGLLRDPRLKRAIDVAGSLALIGALTPVLGACAAAVRLSSPGPILFRQRRIGRDGQPFEMLKFRTMHQNADQSAHQQYVARLIAGTADAHDAEGAAVFKLVGDRRITPAGHWLRRLSLDELPQLINVLRGDMSLVGPRPPLPYEIQHYTPRHLERLAVTPGITGLWQVSGRSRTTFEEMIDLDLAYIERWSVSFDLQILLRTIPVVVFPDGL